MSNLESLAREWIAGQADGGVGSSAWKDRESTMLAVLALPEQQPELAWAFILEVLTQQPSEEVFGVLSASLLEDLLTEPPRFLRRLNTLRGLSYEEDKQVLT